MELLNEIRDHLIRISAKTGEIASESLEITLTTIATLLTENNTPAQADSSGIGNIINSIEKLEDDESFESYLCKIITVSDFAKSMSTFTSQEQEVICVKLLWKSLNKALWTFLQQVTLLLSKLTDDRKYQESLCIIPPSNDICYVLISIFLCLQSLHQIITSFSHALVAQEISLLVDSLAISFLCQGLYQSLSISPYTTLAQVSVHERNNQLRSLGGTGSKRLLITSVIEECSPHINIQLLPAGTYSQEFMIGHVLGEYLDSQSPSLMALTTTVQEALVITLQHTFHTSNPSHDHAIVVEYLERVFTSVHVAIARHWDVACGDCFISDQITSIAVLSSLSFMRHRKVLGCNLAGTSSSLTAIVAVAMRLIDHRYDEIANTLGLYLLQQAVSLTSSSMHLKPIAQWISPHLLQQRSIVIGHVAQLLLVEILLDMWLCCYSTSSASFTANGSELQMQQMPHELLDCMLRDVLKDYNHDKLWHRWSSLIKPLRILSVDIVTCHLTLLHDCIMHSLNVFHLPVQRLLVVFVLPEILFKRVLSDMMGAYTIKICTELIRLLIFYTRRLTPDLSLADDEKQSEFIAEVKNLLRLYQVKCQREYVAWKEAMNKAIAAKEREEKGKVETVELIKRLITSV